VSFQWEDDLGLTNSTPWSVEIAALKDAPPQPEFLALFRDMAILESEVLPIVIRTRDDYGVKQTGMDWRSQTPETSTNETPRREFVFDTESRTEPVVEHTFNFSPAVLRIPADTTVELQTYAIDYLPGREPSYSPVFRVHVLGNARHAEMARQNLESL